MRDALSLTDQAIAYSAGQITEETARGMLGALDQGYLLRVLDALADGDGPTLMRVVDEIATRSLSFSGALQDLGALLHRIALMQMMPSRETVDDDSVDDDIDTGVADDEHLRKLAARFSPEDVQLYYQIAALGRRDLALAPDETTGFSMTLLRMLAFRPEAGSEATRSATPVRAAAAQSAPSRTTSPLQASRAIAAAVAVPAVDKGLEREPAPRVAKTDDAARSIELGPGTDAAAPLPIDDWLAVVGQLGLTGLTRELVQQAELVAHDYRSITLRVPIKSLLGGATLDKLKAALAERFGRPVAVAVEVGAVQGATVAAAKKDERATRQAEAQAIIDADPFVQTLVRDFGASVVPGSVKPV
jgi:DNA polymerase-3 subunit gamma/tau